MLPFKIFRYLQDSAITESVVLATQTGAVVPQALQHRSSSNSQRKGQ
jgi:hypothetical protein